MGNKTNTTRYETVVQLIVLAALVLAPYLAFNFMDFELFSISKSLFITLWSFINPWLCPPYVYLLTNFIIMFIVMLSFIHSNTIIYDSANQSLTDSLIDTHLISQSLEVKPLSDDEFKFHKQDDTYKDHDHDLKSHKFEGAFKGRHDDLKCHTFEEIFKERVSDDQKKFHILEDKFEDRVNDDHLKFNKLEDTFREEDVDLKFKKIKEVVPGSLVDKRELRKSRTFHEGGSRSRTRRERYVRILSQEEFNQQVESFICRFKKDRNVQK